MAKSHDAPGVQIVRDAEMGEQRRLRQNEYYALMVMDTANMSVRPKSDYYDWSKGWVGLERTSEGGVYISKNYQKRHDVMRGQTMVVKVSPGANVSNLDRFATPRRKDITELSIHG